MQRSDEDKPHRDTRDEQLYREEWPEDVDVKNGKDGAVMRWPST